MSFATCAARLDEQALPSGQDQIFAGADLPPGLVVYVHLWLRGPRSLLLLAFVNSNVNPSFWLLAPDGLWWLWLSISSPIPPTLSPLGQPIAHLSVAPTKHTLSKMTTSLMRAHD